MIDAYKIGVNIAMTNNASSVIRVIARDILGLHGHVNMTTAAIGRMRLAIVGAAGVIGGAAILGVFKELTNTAKEFRVEQSRLIPAGFTPQQAVAASRQAWSVATSTPGANLEHTLAHQRELREILGSAEAARLASPGFEKLSVALAAQTGVDADSGMKNLAKAIQMQQQQNLFGKDGEFDPDKFNNAMNAGYRFLVAANGFVTPEAMNTMMQQAGASAEAVHNPEAYWRTKLLQGIEQGGARSGTGDAAFWRALMGGTLPGTERKQAWADLGLGSIVGKGQSKRFVLSRANKDILGGEGGENEFFDKILLPALAKKGITSANAIREWGAMNLPTETARRNFNLNANRAGMKNALNIYDTTPGFEASYKSLVANNPELKIKAFNEAWHSLMVSLGLPMVDNATNIMLRMSKAINRLAKVSSENPEIVGGLEVIIGSIAALSVVGGSFAILKAGLMPFVNGIRSLVGVLAAPQVVAASTSATTLGSGLGALAAGLAKLAGPLAVFAAIMHPGATNGGEDDMLKRFRGMSPDQQQDSMQPGNFQTNKPQPGLLDSLIDKMGIPRMSGAPATPPSPADLATGGRAQHSSFLDGARVGQGPRIQTVTYVQLDKRTIAKAVSEEQGRRFSGPDSGASGYSGRVSPMTPGGLVSA